MKIRMLILAATGVAILGSFVKEDAASAAEIKVLSVNGVKLVLGDLITDFEQKTGHKVTVNYGEAGILRKRVEEGEMFDVSILTRLATDELVKQDKIVTGSPVNIVRTAFGIGVRIGSPKPNTSSLDAFKRSLLEARSIVYTDPATGGASGVFFARVLESLGIADQIKPKSRLTEGVLNAKFVAAGEADFAVQTKPEILAVPGIEFVPMPSEYQSTGSINFTASVGVSAREPDVAKAFVEFCSGPAAAPLITAKGMEPGS